MDDAELRRCTRCALAKTRQRVVVGSGPPEASLMVVGEAPGRSEDEGGEPFVGRSGQLLMRLLEEELGLSRADYFVTNVVKCRPPRNRTPTSAEIAACRPWLEGQLDQRRPRFVLCVGQTAVRAVMGLRTPMAQCHGSVLEVRGARAVATYHPAAALRQGPIVEAVMRADLTILRSLGGGA